MKYFVKFPNGPAYDYKLDDMRSDFERVKLTRIVRFVRTVKKNG